MSRFVGSRAPGAAVRAVIVALLVALPQLLLGQGTGGAPQLVVLVALLAALFTFSEYRAQAPSLVEFRDARPTNRLLVVGLAGALLVGCALLRAGWDEALAVRSARWLGEAWARLLDLPWSPVHHLLSTLPPGADPRLVQVLFAVAAAAYGLSLLTIVLFAVAIRVQRWPGTPAFNLWVNLPQFDPSVGDVVQRLRQNALVNVSLGLMLPLIIPIVADVLRVGFEGPALRDPAALIWVVVAWAFVPAALAMRGLALHRLAHLIAAQRVRRRVASGLPQPA
jgi:hypothetical protein